MYYPQRKPRGRIKDRLLKYPDARSKDGFLGLLSQVLLDLDLASWAIKDGMTWNT